MLGLSVQLPSVARKFFFFEKAGRLVGRYGLPSRRLGSGTVYRRCGRTVQRGIEGAVFAGGSRVRGIGVAALWFLHGFKNF
jgi:hypothetical protein